MPVALDPYTPAVDAAARDRRLDLLHVSFGIPDLDVTTDERYDDLLERIGQHLARGVVYVHCWGGVGRTGTVIGALLASRGHSYDEIIGALTQARQGTRKAHRSCPETDVQLEALRRRAARPPA